MNTYSSPYDIMESCPEGPARLFSSQKQRIGNKFYAESMSRNKFNTTMRTLMLTNMYLSVHMSQRSFSITEYSVPVRRITLFQSLLLSLFSTANTTDPSPQCLDWSLLFRIVSNLSTLAHLIYDRTFVPRSKSPRQMVACRQLSPCTHHN
jgi:hypothetical protein